MLWALRCLWFSLPLTVGTALGDRVSQWPAASVATFAALAYAAWAIGLLALLSPRAISFTALRIVGAIPFVATMWAWATQSALLHPARTSGALLLASALHALVAGGFALSSLVDDACVDAQSYGDEIRTPLRTPPLMLLVVIAAVAMVIGGIGTGPLLIADGRRLLGAVVSVCGFSIAAALIRSLHTLSRRFCVFVPAGLVVSDSLLLVDPVLLPREQIARIRSMESAKPSQPTIDSRLGAVAGGIEVSLHEEGQFVLRSTRNEIRTVGSRSISFTPLRPTSFMRIARTRGLVA